MIDLVLFVGLPYVALASLAVGSIVRHRSNRFGVSSLSSQVLESRRLLWGSVPFHLGIGVLFVGHLLPFLFPDLWRRAVARPGVLLTVEVVGAAAGLLALFGLVVLLVRRVTSARLLEATRFMDLAILGLLVAQVGLGLWVALSARWGAVWSTGTTTPYLWSLLSLRPDASYVAQMPWPVQAHLVGAWVIFLLVPFSRLVHLFYLPLGYLTRPPQKVVWSTRRRLEARTGALRKD